jgi:hypothetical protein
MRAWLLRSKTSQAVMPHAMRKPTIIFDSTGAYACTGA